MAFYQLEQLIKVTDGYRNVFDLPGKSVLLMREDGITYLLNNSCPHLGVPLSNGRVKEGVIRCSGHGMRFDLNTGSPIHNSSPCEKLEVFNAEYNNGYIGVSF